MVVRGATPYAGHGRFFRYRWLSDTRGNDVGESVRTDAVLRGVHHRRIGTAEHASSHQARHPHSGGSSMIQVMHWLASFIVLSVALAQLEAVKINSVDMLLRAAGWCLLGLESFSSIIKPLWPQYATGGCELGMIGLAVLAVSYRWQGATKRPPQGRASDHARQR